MSAQQGLANHCHVGLRSEPHDTWFGMGLLTDFEPIDKHHVLTMLNTRQMCHTASLNRLFANWMHRSSGDTVEDASSCIPDLDPTCVC
jgi:hypothetical protein